VAAVCPKWRRPKDGRFRIADTSMSMEIKARDLLAAGWHEDRRFGSILRRARELQETGLDADGVFAALEVDYPKDAVLAGLRPAPAPLFEAVEAETPAETASVAASRARMLELLHAPIVRRGALMPDTCPAGQGVATIPVGGAIEAENALLPPTRMHHGRRSAGTCVAKETPRETRCSQSGAERMDGAQRGIAIPAKRSEAGTSRRRRCVPR
jgi:hypothetical protein